MSPLVLLLIQVANEASTHEFHDVLRILIPIGFNAYRLIPLFTWVGAMGNSKQAGVLEGEGLFFTFGLALAIANLLMWKYNLFVFLLLRTLPFPAAAVLRRAVLGLKAGTCETRAGRTKQRVHTHRPQFLLGV